MEELRQFVNQMQSTSSSLDKVEILKKQSDFIKKVLRVHLQSLQTIQCY
jgi:hypothetical protein